MIKAETGYQRKSSNPSNFKKNMMTWRQTALPTGKGYSKPSGIKHTMTQDFLTHKEPTSLFAEGIRQSIEKVIRALTPKSSGTAILELPCNTLSVLPSDLDALAPLHHSLCSGIIKMQFFHDLEFSTIESCQLCTYTLPPKLCVSDLMT